MMRLVFAALAAMLAAVPLLVPAGVSAAGPADDFPNRQMANIRID